MEDKPRKRLGIFGNFFVVSTVVFVVWMTFFDSNSWLHQRKTWKRYKELKETNARTLKALQKDSIRMKELESDPKAIEKLAREEYYLKKPNEQIFIIEETNDQ